MARKLPPFRPVTQAELRQIWSEQPSSRRLVLEIERYRRVIATIDSLYKTAHQAWRDHLGGNLTALHLLQQVMTEERQRLPTPFPPHKAPDLPQVEEPNDLRRHE